MSTSEANKILKKNMDKEEDENLEKDSKDSKNKTKNNWYRRKIK